MEEIEKEWKKLRKNGRNWKSIKGKKKVYNRRIDRSTFRIIDKRRSKYALHAYRERLLKYSDTER